MLPLWCHIYLDMMDVKRMVVRIFRGPWMGKLGQKFHSLKLAWAIFVFFSLLVTWLNSIVSLKWIQWVLSQFRFTVLWIMILPKMKSYCVPSFFYQTGERVLLSLIVISLILTPAVELVIKLYSFWNISFSFLICHWWVLVCPFMCYNWQTKLLNTLNLPLMN